MTFFIVLMILGSYGTAAASGGSGCYSSIISFGASISDTGNFMLSHGDKECPVCNFPYGETYFHHPTGRFSDGRIFLDFFAEALGLPFIPPFLGGSSGYAFRKGVNFAVGGATALDISFLMENGFSQQLASTTNYSLRTQMEWFKQLIPSICSSHSGTDCGILRESLFIVGEFGGNDYSILAAGNTTLNERRHTYVPKVVKAIISAITELIELGARTLLVPGIYPIGCTPACLTKLSGTSVGYTDPIFGCIKRVNDFAQYHNEKLLEELDQIRRVHPSATIIYVDSYNNTLDMFRSPRSYGFGSTLVACCGGGGPYNFNSSALCGTENAEACDDPSRYIYWDQFHFTEAANRIIANGLLNDLFTNPHLNQIKCPSGRAETNHFSHQYMMQK